MKVGVLALQGDFREHGFVLAGAGATPVEVRTPEQLAEVDTADVAPMTSVAAMRLPMREDEVTDGDRRDDILRNAPQSARGFFAVPKVVE